MSLLMDALKKAEAAKRQGAEGSMDAPAQPPSAPLSFADMKLEPIDEPAPVIAVSSPEIAPISDAGPADRLREIPTNLPELPSNLSNLDAEFVAHHEASKAALESAPRVKAVVVEPARSSPAVAPVAESENLAKPIFLDRELLEAKIASGASSASDTNVQAERDAARNMFEAKVPAAPANRRKFAMVIGILSTTVALGIVGYFWWQLQSTSPYSNSNFAGRPPAPTPTPPATVANPSAGTPAATVEPVGPSGAPNASGPSSAPSTSTKSASQPTEDDDEDTAPTVAAKVATAPESRRKKAPVAAEAETGDDNFRLVRSTKSQLQINPALSKAYDDFNRGNLAAAKTAYESVAKLEPHNVEALHGLAAIAVSEKRWNAADHYYERIIVADPKDATALAGLINLHGQNNPIAAESRLKGITAEQPDSAAAQFALGNLYAAQQRWTDAQQVYFKAYSADAENPDILYNLAVSLEHMNQSKLARQYYVLALDAAKRRPAGFDSAKVGARIAALQLQ